METPIVAEFLGGLVRSSWHEAVLAGLLGLVVWLMGDHLDARWRCRLWMLVLLRLAWPFFLPSPVSLFNWVGGALGSEVGGEAGVDDPEHTLPFLLEQGPVQNLWLLGALALVFGALVSLVRVIRLRCRSRDLTFPGVREILVQCRREMGVTVPVRLLESWQVTSPCLLGILRPSIVMPEGLVGDLTQEQLRLVFRHEMAHLRRWDLPFNWLLAAIQTFHWFNPLAWFVVRRILADREEVCDSIAVEGRPEACRPYGELLVKIALRSGSWNAERVSSGGTVGLTGAGGRSFGDLCRRLRALRRVGSDRRSSWVGAILWLALLVAGFTDAVPRPTEETHRPGQIGWQHLIPERFLDQNDKTPEGILRGL
ncbi:MAG: Regulatory protein BlaR1 [Verrucomicrobiota bacterium]|jgi:beta-lactamase regulating signal transducer with metallopeptidase domain